MTGILRSISQLFAVVLIVLGVAPFTAPFATCDLTKDAHSSDEPAVPGQDFPSLKGKVSAEPIAADLGGTVVAPPSLDLVARPIVPLVYWTDQDQVRHNILRI